MHNHHLLQVEGRPKWLTLRGGRWALIEQGLIDTLTSLPSSRTYVQKILSRLPSSQLHLSTPIRTLKTIVETQQKELITASGEKLTFDHVIFACHSDTTVDILEAGDGLTSEEASILGAFKWNKNEAVLHSDVQVRRVQEYDTAVLTRNSRYGVFSAHAQGRIRLVKLELSERVRDRPRRKVPPKHQPSLVVRRELSAQKC